MGTVDLVLRREGEFRRLHAMKRLHPHLLEDEEIRAMFLDEARVAGLVRHANVVSVLDVGEDAEGPYLVMDYVEGLTLAHILQHHGALEQLLPIQICARIGGDIARGLAAAHELRGHDGRLLQLVHRDVSPANVLVGFDGSVRLADFGIARAVGRSSKLTAAGVVKGKLGYMAPEQLRFEEADARSDLFAMGVVLYELVAGKRLYRDTAEIAASRILNEPAPDIGDEREDVPPELTELLFELLAKRREDRPISARAVAERLEAIVAVSLREEEPIAVASYMEQVFGEEHRSKEAALAQAIASWETPKRSAKLRWPPKRSAKLRWPPKRSAKLRWRLAGALAVAGAVAGALAVIRSVASRPTPSVATETEASPANVEAASEPAPDPAGTPTAASDHPPPPTAPSSTSSTPAGGTGASGARARPAEPRAKRANGIPMWDWK
jgi:serine/threonine-protein kinase